MVKTSHGRRLSRRLLLSGLLLVGLIGSTWGGHRAEASIIPPLEVDILDARESKVGKAFVYPNFIELQDRTGTPKGAIGIVMAQGRVQLFLVGANKERKLIGWAENRRLFNSEDKLVGYYYWTAIWNYVYDLKMKKVGQSQCLAYQGLCAAGVAGYLLGLF